MGDVNWSLGFTLPNPVVRSNDLKIYIYTSTYKCWEDTSFCIGWWESEIKSSNCPCSIYVCFLGDEFLKQQHHSVSNAQIPNLPASGFVT